MSFQVTPPFILRRLSPGITWKIPTTSRHIHLTFDDGPIPEVTAFVLDQLKQHAALASFFCLGKNVIKHDGLFKRIVEEGHGIGNHTFNHLNGWKTSHSAYSRDVIAASKVISSNLFRPPYGRITVSQARSIMKRYKIIMWDVLSYDFDKNTSKEKCLHNVISHTKPGSIVVFHDSLKASKNLEYVLPRYLEWIGENNFKCKKIN